MAIFLPLKDSKLSVTLFRKLSQQGKTTAGCLMKDRLERDKAGVRRAVQVGDDGAVIEELERKRQIQEILKSLDRILLTESRRQKERI